MGEENNCCPVSNAQHVKLHKEKWQCKDAHQHLLQFVMLCAKDRKGTSASFAHHLYWLRMERFSFHLL